jgi:hypothetical protein
VLLPPFIEGYVVNEFNSDLSPVSFFAEGSNIGLMYAR